MEKAPIDIRPYLEKRPESEAVAISKELAPITEIAPYRARKFVLDFSKKLRSQIMLSTGPGEGLPFNRRGDLNHQLTVLEQYVEDGQVNIKVSEGTRFTAALPRSPKGNVSVSVGADLVNKSYEMLDEERTLARTFLGVAIKIYNYGGVVNLYTRQDNS